MKPVVPAKLFALILIGLAAATPIARAEDAPAGTVEFEKFEFRPFVGEPVQAQRAMVTVPERHGVEGGRTITLPVVRIPSRAKEPKAPVVYLAGGPGGSGYATALTPRFVLFRALTKVADVIIYDQRGTGRARPKLTCRARLELPLDRPGDERTVLDALAEHCRQCAQKLRAADHDLETYTTAQSAHDLERLRVALGTDKLTLWGTSYGTHLALAYTRLYPTRVERLVLVGVEGPDHTLKLPSDQQKQLEKLAAWVQEDPDVSRAIPDFVALVRETLERVEHEPVTVEFEPRRGSEKIKIVIGKWDLQLLTANAIGRTRSARGLPALYYAMSQGDFSAVAPQVYKIRRFRLMPPMSFLMDGASGATPARLARIEREAGECLLGNAVNFPFPGINAAWNAPDLGDAFRAPLHSDVPALLISGTLDGRTPPSNAEEVLKGFPNGRHLLIEGTGHDEELFSSTDEMRRRVVAFVAGESISTEPIRAQRPQLEWPDRE